MFHFCVICTCPDLTDLALWQDDGCSGQRQATGKGAQGNGIAAESSGHDPSRVSLRGAVTGYYW